MRGARLVIFDVRASFEVALQTDTHLVLIDLDQEASVTNDAEAVIAWLAANLGGGIGKRKVYYRDTDGRFDEIKVNAGAFAGFAPCSEGQQTALAKMLGQ
ncbi:hypothetical protein PTE_01758 [Photorhabdus khanii NC19]|uniref:Uncharacterized protein n=1 Tax=Photorhabdus khanii NC19 TaxID=1004151 RepID=W3V843_9GAMM|nr:hypothetical protein PTE_01758 [Photorhabdus khanii NC19]